MLSLWRCKTVLARHMDIEKNKFTAEKETGLLTSDKHDTVHWVILPCSCQFFIIYWLQRTIWTPFSPLCHSFSSSCILKWGFFPVNCHSCKPTFHLMNQGKNPAYLTPKSSCSGCSALRWPRDNGGKLKVGKTRWTPLFLMRKQLAVFVIRFASALTGCRKWVIEPTPYKKL